MSVYDRLGVPTLVNAKGTATRLSGGPLRPEVVRAMGEAAGRSVDMADLQAAASRAIAAATGAEAGYVASGAAACLMLATAACLTGLDPAAMARLPDTRGRRNEVVVVRSQRNGYDHAVRAAGAVFVEVGLPDRHAGSGVRDAEAWEIEAAVTPATAAVFYVADASARPPLAEVAAVAARHGLPVIVDAAAQLPPARNLRRFLEEGATLVAFSGGKAIGGPQATGFLAGRRDLVMAAALQHLDMDVDADLWRPPAGLVDRERLAGLPQHGIGRACKVGKEEVVGLLEALRLFQEEGDAVRHARWLQRLHRLRAALSPPAGVTLAIEGEDDTEAVPRLVIGTDAPGLDLRPVVPALIDGRPSIHLDASRRTENRLVINPMSLLDEDLPVLAEALAVRLAEAAAAPRQRRS